MAGGSTNIDPSIAASERDSAKELIKEAIRELLAEPNALLGLMPPLDDCARLVARFSSANALRLMPGFDGVAHFSNQDDLVRFACAAATATPGPALEFGVATGGSIRLIAECLASRDVIGFDSFEGLPEPWHHHDAGAYSQGGTLPSTPANVSLVKGWFEDSLPLWVPQNADGALADGVALLHVDCDIYSATRTVFEHLGDFIRPGTIVLFDEYWNYSNWERHEHRAWTELLASSGKTATLIGYNRHGWQAAFRIDP